jgi:anti-sigma factor RsiW
VCRHALELMTAYLDGDLAEPGRSRLEGHLATCPHCHEYLAELRVTVLATGKVDPDALSDDALDDLVNLYRQWQSG